MCLDVINANRTCTVVRRINVKSTDSMCMCYDPTWTYLLRDAKTYGHIHSKNNVSLLIGGHCGLCLHSHSHSWAALQSPAYEYLKVQRPWLWQEQNPSIMMQPSYDDQRHHAKIIWHLINAWLTSLVIICSMMVLWDSLQIQDEKYPPSNLRINHGSRMGILTGKHVADVIPKSDREDLIMYNSCANGLKLLKGAALNQQTVKKLKSDSVYLLNSVVELK